MDSGGSAVDVVGGEGLIEQLTSLPLSLLLYTPEHGRVEQ